MGIYQVFCRGEIRRDDPFGEVGSLTRGSAEVMDGGVEPPEVRSRCSHHCSSARVPAQASGCEGGKRADENTIVPLRFDR